MVATQRPLTYDDLLLMPDDGNRYEVIGGELIVTLTPISNHQRVVGRLYRLIDDCAIETGAGEVLVAPLDVVLGPNDSVEPDLVFINAKDGPVPGDENRFNGAPDLVVEVISPSSRRNDRVRKLLLYARSGVPEYWIAEPQSRTLNIHYLELGGYVLELTGDDGRIASRVLPELRVDPEFDFANLAASRQ